MRISDVSLTSIMALSIFIDDELRLTYLKCHVYKNILSKYGQNQQKNSVDTTKLDIYRNP